MKVIPYLDDEQIEKIFPKFDTWWRKTFHWFTISPESTIKTWMKYMDSKGLTMEVPDDMGQPAQTNS